MKTCKCPNKIIYKHQLPQNAKGQFSTKSCCGSLVSKFNPNGSCLAFHCFTAVRDEHDIFIMEIKNFKISTILRGHFGVIYDLDWFDERTLVSVSSDRTAIIWLIENDMYTMTVS